MDYYGCRLATCSSDRSVRIYDVKNGTQTLAADLRGHEGPVSLGKIPQYLDKLSFNFLNYHYRSGKLRGPTPSLETSLPRVPMIVK